MREPTELLTELLTKLLTEQQIEALKGIPDLTPEQQALLRIVFKQMVIESMDEGIKAAVAMIRLAPSEMPLAELANRIEAVIED